MPTTMPTTVPSSVPTSVPTTLWHHYDAKEKHDAAEADIVTSTFTDFYYGWYANTVDEMSAIGADFLSTIESQLDSPFDLEYYDGTFHNSGIVDTTVDVTALEEFNSTYSCSDYFKIDPVIQQMKSDLGYSVGGSVVQDAKVDCDGISW